MLVVANILQYWIHCPCIEGEGSALTTIMYTLNCDEVCVSLTQEEANITCSIAICFFKYTRLWKFSIALIFQGSNPKIVFSKIYFEM